MSHRPLRPRPVRDVHGGLAATRVAGVVRPRTRAALARFLRERRGPVAVSGGRHAMGGQAFARGRVLLDLRALDRVFAFDAAAGRITVEAGIDWPALIAATRRLPGGWAIAQKQTGADAMTIGGSVAVNAHGRGLAMPPLSAHVRSLGVLLPDGTRTTCSRSRAPGRFADVVGGYGLFGVIDTVELQLVRRARLRRRVEVRDSDGLMDAFAGRVAEGARYGDFQATVDPASPDFLRRGVFTVYEPTDDPPTRGARQLREADFRRLLWLAHVDKARGFEEYAEHYRRTDGQVYESDEHQLAAYPRGYHAEIDVRLGHRGSEMLTELFVPRPRFDEFLTALRRELRRSGADPIYSTVRLVERDDDAFLAWAREPWACLILNLHVRHGDAGLARARRQFRGLIDTALACGGTFYLTYHRWATAEQLRAGHPRLEEFLARKRAFDPAARFTSDWYEHVRRVLDPAAAHASAGR